MKNPPKASQCDHRSDSEFLYFDYILNETEYQPKKLFCLLEKCRHILVELIAGRRVQNQGDVKISAGLSRRAQHQAVAGLARGSRFPADQLYAAGLIHLGILLISREIPVGGHELPVFHRTVRMGDVKAFLHDKQGIINPLMIQSLEKTRRNVVLRSALSFGAGIRQLSRLTGISFGVIQKLKNDQERSALPLSLSVATESPR